MRRAWLPLAVAVAIGTTAAGGMAGRHGVPPVRPNCVAPPALLGIGTPLTRVASRLKAGAGLTIVALGSSSTRGVGASSPRNSYPSQLETDLRALLPAVAVRVVNRGASGEEVPQMLARLDRDVLAEHPDLVIWQLGTNAVLHGADPDREAPLIARGIGELKRRDIDIVLMDLQFAPRVLAKRDYAGMERVIAAAARREHVGLFRRFAMMQAWQAGQPTGAAPLTVSADGLHMNDRGYDCLAVNLAEALIGTEAASLHPMQGRDAGTLASVAGGRRALVSGKAP